MKVLLTGADGYIGTRMSGVLLDRGHDVTGVDTGFHRAGWLFNGVEQTPKMLTRDVRSLEVSDLRGYDAVVHLAELSNDPVGELNPDITFKINHEGSLRLARIAKEAGVSRFVHMSSCSVYGASGEAPSDENSPVEPLTAYAKCKILVERDVSALADDDFSPTFMRNATAYGASPRQRFDLVVNNLAGHAWTRRVIQMDSDGSPWRPFVHILDISKAVACALAAPRELVHNERFNVGNNESNYQIRTIAEVISATFPGCALSVGTSSGDRRNYRADFSKIATVLPDFVCDWNVEKGAKELLEVFRAVDMSLELFESRGHTRLKQIRHLIETKQLDEDFFWYSV